MGNGLFRTKRDSKVTLDGSDATGKLVPALPQRFLHETFRSHDRIARVWLSAWRRGPWVPPVRGPAAFQQLYEHPWGASPTLLPNCFCQAR
jgi:hypothetical protein